MMVLTKMGHTAKAILFENILKTKKMFIKIENHFFTKKNVAEIFKIILRIKKLFQNQLFLKKSLDVFIRKYIRK